jgi:hypothetical protein
VKGTLMQICPFSNGLGKYLILMTSFRDGEAEDFPGNGL